MSPRATAKPMKNVKPAPIAEASGLGLEGIGDLSGVLSLPEQPVGGGPIDLDLSLIDEDPHQPRAYFDPESLQEMAETIKLRGVKTPISVRPNPSSCGRFIINHGARRYRASIFAGKDTIPGFIDPDYTEEDQVIENLQRDGLTPREIADFIGRELSKGMKKGEIAKAIGKSPAFVTQHAALLDLPDPIAEVFNTGRCRDVTVINELITVFKQTPEPVTSWLSDENQEITRGAVKLLREFLDTKKKATAPAEDAINRGEDEGQSDIQDRQTKQEADPNKLRKPIVHVQHNGRPARLILTRRPQETGHAWLKYEDDGQEFAADLSTVQLVALMEG